MSFNLHCHLHLCDQVKKFGSLISLSGFPLEAVFKVCKNLFFGTVNIAKQIATNIEINSRLFYEFRSEEISKISKLELRLYAEKMIKPDNLRKLISKSNHISLNEISNEIEKNLILELHYLDFAKINKVKHGYTLYF